MHERYRDARVRTYALHNLECIDLLVVALPVATLNARKRAALGSLELGWHDVRRGMPVQAEWTRVAPQPQGALMYYGYVRNHDSPPVSLRAVAKAPAAAARALFKLY